MAFSKSFPRTIEGSSYPIWEVISLTESEEKACENAARHINNQIMRECLRDAKTIVRDDDYDIEEVAIALFEKRASHVVYHKERMCKEKFDKKF